MLLLLLLLDMLLLLLLLLDVAVVVMMLLLRRRLMVVMAREAVRVCVGKQRGRARRGCPCRAGRGGALGLGRLGPRAWVVVDG